MKTRLSILLLSSLFLSGCGATAVPTATLVQSTPTVLAPQEPTSTVSIVTPTLDVGTSVVTEQTAIPESTMTPEATATIGQVKMEVLPDGQQTALPPPAVCQQPQNWVAYTVARNDTLSSLGQRTGTSWQQIQSANCLTSTTVFAGQILLLPFMPAPPVGITEVPIIEPPEPPPPGPPDVSVRPGTGPIPTIYTFVVIDFDADEPITIIVWSRDNSSEVERIQVTVDGDGKFDVPWISQNGDPTGGYTVYVNGGNGKNKDVGYFEVEPSVPTLTPNP